MTLLNRELFLDHPNGNPYLVRVIGYICNSFGVRYIAVWIEGPDDGREVRFSA
jgi:hypothetical protein